MFESRNNSIQYRALLYVLLASVIFTAGIKGQSTSETPAQKVDPAIGAKRLGDSFAEIAKRVEPAVVSIDTKGKMPESARTQSPPADSDDIMEFFKRQLPRRPSYSVGSGFIVDKSGYILTNEHVVEDAAKITVKLESGEEFPATVVGTDDETDLAVIKIAADRDLPFVKLGNSDEARVGEWVLAIGSPFGLTRSVTAGIISQMNRETPYSTAFQKFIQTDAAINRGNSGGPLVNMDGDVIGINSQIATSTGDYNGVGFALPSTEARYVYDQILKSGKVRRGFLGVSLESVKAEFASVYGLADAHGAIVTDVRNPKSAAAAAGLKAGDVIVEFNGQKIRDAQDLISKVAAATPEQSVSIQYLRESGQTLDKRSTSIKVDERPTSGRRGTSDLGRGVLPIERAKEDGKPFGLTLVELTPALGATYKLEGQKGLLVKDVSPESYIADVKISSGTDALSEGDLIQRINRTPVTDPKAFADLVNRLKKGDAVVLHVLTYNPASRTPQLKIVQFTVQ
ncbi:MAG: Do family serine endopeptidase [Acidobacteriota bacterium]